MSAQVVVLRFVSGLNGGQSFPLSTDAVNVIGRGDGVALKLDDDTVSRKHARVWFEGDEPVIDDLGSRNGTIVNGRSIRRHRMRVGDRIAIGGSLLKVELEALADVQARKKREAGGDQNRSMTGSLEDIPLTDVLQWLATSRKTGRMDIKRDNGRVGHLLLRDGSVYYASIEGMARISARKALLRMMGWSDGRFSLDAAGATDVEEELQIPLEFLLMESARQQDELSEWIDKRARRAGEDTVAFPAETQPLSLDPQASTRWSTLDAAALDVLQRLVVGGARTLGELYDSIDTDDASIAKGLAALLDARVIVAV